MNLSDVSDVTGLSIDRLSTCVQKGFLPARERIRNVPKGVRYEVSPDVVYDFARGQWFSNRTAMTPPPEVAEKLLKNYGKDLSEPVRNKLMRLRYEAIEPRMDSKTKIGRGIT